MSKIEAARQIVIVSDTIPYPARSGDNVRLAEMIHVLRREGWFVHLVLTALLDASARKLCRSQVDALHVYNGAGLRTRTRNLSRRAVRLADRVGKRYGILPLEELAGRLLGRKMTPLVVDYWQRYPTGFDDFLHDLSARHEWKAIIVEFIWLHRAIDKLPGSILRILDTHDIQHKRVADFASRGMSFPLSITRDLEAEIFRRFDAILAIQSHEASIIRQMCPDRPVLTVGTACANAPRPADQAVRGRVLYVGGYNGANVDGLDRFFKHCWPRIVELCPHAHLRVCGFVYRGFHNATFPKVEFLGHVRDLAPHYAEAELVVNPVWIGTGLKIKTVEALSFGAPLVTTPTGTAGMHDDVAKACMIADDEQEFVREVVRLLSDSSARRNLEAAARRFTSDHLSFSDTYNDLIDFLDRSS